MNGYGVTTDGNDGGEVRYNKFGVALLE